MRWGRRRWAPGCPTTRCSLRSRRSRPQPARCCCRPQTLCPRRALSAPARIVQHPHLSVFQQLAGVLNDTDCMSPSMGLSFYTQTCTSCDVSFCWAHPESFVSLSALCVQMKPHCSANDKSGGFQCTPGGTSRTARGARCRSGCTAERPAARQLPCRPAQSPQSDPRPR